MGSVLLDIAGIAAHRRPCPATTEGVRPENKGEQYRPTRRPLRRSSS